ncbi:alpha/beta hydrolase-fold protein [Planctobacterium marinum]|uniref:Phosphonate ABC transporter ATP-binding protein n=1 Tax=Planctobacterium marinum TaxID=1631968 RepID=A0AA48I327_9ALTE|nr:phosphonate ABC transporter ATP-binding protein [Planctobacterium marinum]
MTTSTINFAVNAGQPCPALWITGNHKNIGNWDPEGLPLHNDNGVWKSSLEVPTGTRLEFKITDGTWEKEAIVERFPAKENILVVANQDMDVQLSVAHWHQNPPAMPDHIQGQVDYLGHMSGSGIRDREVIVWLPTAYLASPRKKFPVLYMHDGQNLVDPNTAFLHSDWRIDETIERLAAEGRITPPIIVGLYNTEDRLEEYADTESGRNYLRFIKQQVKPLIDANYRTLKSKKHTAVMGSSMGGLISFLAAWYHPEIFGQAACLSPMFWGKKMVNVKAWQMVEANPKQPLNARIYMDNGTKELERSLMPGCVHMLRVLEDRGYQQGKNLMWFKDEGAWHNEAAWAARVWKPLEFMFGK